MVKVKTNLYLFDGLRQVRVKVKFGWLLQGAVTLVVAVHFINGQTLNQSNYQVKFNLKKHYTLF